MSDVGAWFIPPFPPLSESYQGARIWEKRASFIAMTITCNHSSSSYGQPVILNDSGMVMDYWTGIKALRAKLGLSVQDLATECGVSKRTVEGWEQGRMPTTQALIVMAKLVGSTI